MHYILIIPIGGLWRDAIQVAVLVSQPQHVFRGLMKASLGGFYLFPSTLSTPAEDMFQLFPLNNQLLSEQSTS